MPSILPPPTQNAKVTSLALSDVPTSDRLNNNEVDTKVLDRIRKCLERAHHPNTPEPEAKAALRMSSRLMALYNVTQTEVLAAADTSETMAQLGGQSVVQITSVKVHGRATNQTWVSDVVHAIEIFFDCKSYSTQRLTSIEWTFYGIAANTVAAAMSFEMVHNLIQEWVRSKKGITTKNSYCLGVARGLYRAALTEKQKEEEAARRKEQEDLANRIEQENEMRQHELDRLKTTIETQQDDVKDETSSNHDSPNASLPFGMSPSPNLDEDEILPDTDGDDDGFMDVDEMPTNFKEEEEEPLNLLDDLETQLHSMMEHQDDNIKSSIEDGETKIKDEGYDDFLAIPSVNGSIDNNDGESQPLSVWASASALIHFRQKSVDVADEYLRSRNKKLRKSRARKRSVRDQTAYRQGKKDSAKIDVKRRRIEYNP